MNKLLLEFSVIVIAFLSVWFALSRIDFITDDDVNKFSKASERKLSELILKTLDRSKPEKFNHQLISIYIDSIGIRLCKANNIPFDSIKIHILENSEVNAFALPDRNMVIYTGLLENAKSAEEVAGVMAHEIGHMEKSHVMRKLIKEIGLSMLFVLAGGNENMEILKETGRVLSSTAFDRGQEREADAFAVEALAKAEIDLEPMGNFIFRLSTGGKDMPEELAWLSTHPDSKDRAAAIFEKKKEYTYTPRPILKSSWETIKLSLKRTSENQE